jgi:N-acyl-D-amino-acid deacylase
LLLSILMFSKSVFPRQPDVSVPGSAHQAVERALPLLQESAATWTRVAKCFSCHHQGLGSLAVAVARERGFPVDEEKFAAQIAVGHAQLAPPAVAISIGTNVGQLGTTFALVALAASGAPRDAATDREVYRILGGQHVSGHWTPFPLRLPLEGSFVSQTAWTIRAVRLFTPPALQKDADAQVARATDWLARQSLLETEDLVMQLLALGWTGASSDRMQHAANQLLAMQRADGGWAQTAERRSDAYATGQALVAVNQAGRIPPTSVPFKKGIAFLMHSQHRDGSWLVETRHTWKRGLAYLESGFPHGKNQFISYAGTAWATMALALSERDERSPAVIGVSDTVTRSQRSPFMTASNQNGETNGDLTPLMRAALVGTRDELRALLENHPDVNAVATPLGVTALMCAAHDPAKVAMLIVAGANVRAVTTAGHTALLVAADHYGAAESVQLLLDHGADPNAPRGTGRASPPLTRAAFHGDQSVASLLVAAGARIDDDPDGSTALMAAVSEGDVEFARFMLDHGASVESHVLFYTAVNNGEHRPTPLMMAADRSQIDLIMLLLERGANVNARDLRGMTPLMYAAGSLDRGPLTTAVVRALITAKADIGARTAGGETALDFAVKYNKTNVVSILKAAADR